LNGQPAPTVPEPAPVIIEPVEQPVPVIEEISSLEVVEVPKPRKKSGPRKVA